MNSERWQKVKVLYSKAISLEPDQREQFLSDACGNDLELKREIEILIESSDDAESFINSPAAEYFAGLIVEKDVRLETGEQVAHYEIISNIGEGGMGEVYLAHDTRLNRKVAIKLLAAHITEDEDRVRRFRQEAFATSALNHPNIITIYEIGQRQNRDFIATEFIEGKTLRSLLSEKTFSIAGILDIAAQIASGLAAAHEAGIIHRDIKPENIMIREDGLVKILDFGIVKYRPVEDGREVLIETAVGEVIGTAAYMSPEQARGLEIDARTDIWSLGVILYEMIAGKLPFEGKTKSDRIAAILEHEPEPLNKARRKVPSELERIVRRSLAKDREERYSEVALIAEDLQYLRETVSGAGPKPLILPSSRKSAFSQQFFLYAALAAVILIVGLAAVYFTGFGKTFWQSSNTKDQTLIEPSSQQLVSTFPGAHTQASFSPNGNRIAFLNEISGVQQIWVKDLNGGDPIQITSEKMPVARPRWSPVGNEILYVQGSGAERGIILITPADKEPRKIIQGGRNPDWSWDGKKIVFERGFDIWTANKDGSDQRRVEGVPQTDLLWADRFPAISPDGSTIAFFQNDKGPMGDYWLIPAEGGQAKRLTSDRIFGGAAAWMPSGTHIIFPSKRGGSMTLWKISAEGGQPEPVLSSPGEDTEPTVSRDGRKLIYTNTRKNNTLMLTDAKSGKSRPMKESRFDIVYPSFSPDGSAVAFFQVDEKGDLHIYAIGTDGKNLRQITKGEGERNLHPQWSDDGKTIYFYQIHPELSFRKVPAEGGESIELIKGWEWSTHNHAQVSPDGTKIIYTKMDRGRPAATMMRDISTGKETSFITTIRQMRWSHSGKFIAGMASDNIMICSIADNLCKKIAGGLRPKWSGDDSKIYYQTYPDTLRKIIWEISPEGGIAKKVAELKPMDIYNPFYAVSSKGEIAWTKFEQSKSELWLVDFVVE